MIEKNANQIEEVGLMTAFTLVVWVIWLTVGAVGLWATPRPPMPPPATQPATMAVEMLNVSTAEPAAAIMPPAAPPPAPDETPSPPPVPSQLPAPPAALAMMQPLVIPEIPTAQPATPPVMPVQAQPMRPAASSSLATTVRTAPAASPQMTGNGPPVERLTVGVGLGRAVDPNAFYPEEALENQQTGIVDLRFTVDAAGNVDSVEIVTPCRWPVLNAAAIRAVRAARFPTGSRHTYEIHVGWQSTQ